MPRWEADARGRLVRAALELFETRGFERTSIARITRTAGLGERSFYRYFPDKREVLFADDELETHLVARVEAADPDLTPFDALLSALGTADEVHGPSGFLRRRTAVIAANPALAERDLIKLAEISTALTRALEHRGVEPGEAGLAVDAAVAVSRRATARWLAAPGAALSDAVAESAAELRRVVARDPEPRRDAGPRPPAPTADTSRDTS